MNVQIHRKLFVLAILSATLAYALACCLLLLSPLFIVVYKLLA